VHLFVIYKPGANPRRIGDRLVKVALSTKNQINQSINHNHYQVRSKSKDWKTKQIGKKYSGTINQKA
jgi:hypothetical protein